jgi:hypothetical protein
MRPLTQDDLLPLEEYAPRRREFFQSQKHYLDLYRRVRIGPSVTLLFENRQTLWFRVQEVLRIARLGDPCQVQQELDVYNQLLPGPHELQAALILSENDPGHPVAQGWRDLSGEHLRLCIGPEQCQASLVTARPEDRAIGLSHWLKFSISDRGQDFLNEPYLTVYLEMVHPRYQYQSLPLSQETRQSLLDDLKLSERDGC